MKIVIASNYEIGSETGTAQVSELLIKYLSKKHQVVYICVGNKYEEFKINKNLSIIKTPSIEVNKIIIPFITPQTAVNIFKKLDKFKPDLIHAQNPLFVSNLAQIWANIYNVPFIVTFHHIPTEGLNHLFPKLEKTMLSKLLQEVYKNISLKSFLSNTDLVIALNKAVYKSIKKVDKKIKIKIINNGLELNKLFKIKRDNILYKKRVNFVFLGSYNHRKNQEFLIRSFKYLPKKYKLNCFGKKETYPFYYKKLKKMITDLKIKNVSLNNFEEKVDIILANSYFFVSASLKEAQSLAVIQALASGLPVIGIKNETIDELILKDNGIKLSKKISPKQFAWQVKNYLSEVDYEKSSKQAQLSAKRFDIKLVIKNIENVYKTLSQSQSNKSGRDIGQNYKQVFIKKLIK